MHDYKRLNVWIKARGLVKEVYILTKKYPSSEIYGLCAQTQKAAVSIPSNIAEGCGRGTNKQLAYFLEIAYGSSCELETQLILAHDLDYISIQEMEEICNSITAIQKMLYRWIQKLESN